MQANTPITAGPMTKKDIWLTTYLHALITLSPSEAESRAEEAVQRYDRRWTSAVLRNFGSERPADIQAV